jgi:hypothetical protein
MKGGRRLDKLKRIIKDGFNNIMGDLDKVGAKKASRDVVKAGLDKIQTELENEFQSNADDLKNRLVISSLENTLKEFREMAGR